MIRFAAAAALAAAVIATPLAAQPSAAVPAPRLAELLRQDASLRQRIGQLQLDQLVARVDQTIGHRAASRRDAATARDLDLYAF